MASKGLIRLHSDGTLANTFGFDGSVAGIALARTDNCELYVLGDGFGFQHFNGQAIPPLVRLTRTGSLDAGFHFTSAFGPFLIAPSADGSGGVYTVFSEPNPNCDNPGCAVLLQIALLKADGTLNPSFSTGNGFIGGSPARADPISITALVPTSNRKLYVGGSLRTFNGANVQSLLRLNADGTLDSTFVTNVGYISGANVVEAMALAGDGTQYLYAGGRIFGRVDGMPITFLPIRVTDTGAPDLAFAPAVPMITEALAPAGDGTGDVLVFGLGTESQDRPQRLLRLNRNGVVVPGFHEPNIVGDIFTIVPALDGTGDIYLGGTFTTYNGQVVNHIARIHHDGTLAGSSTP
jgi:hypothetical protein